MGCGGRALEALEEGCGVSLTGWVARVRRGAARARAERKRELRRVAILSVALARAERDLVTKQRERARRWADLQERLVKIPSDEETEKKTREDELWKGDLKGLDGFFRALDGIKTYDVDAFSDRNALRIDTS